MIFEIRFNINEYQVSLRLNHGPIRVVISPGDILFFCETLEQAYQKLLEKTGVEIGSSNRISSLRK
jgi:hypothetical protein